MTRVELAAIAIGIALLALGIASIAATTLRLRRGATTLLAFGTWCALYGARLLALQPPVRAAIGGGSAMWAHIAALITYTINVPITVFVASLLGVGWRGSIRWLLGAVTAFAIVAITSDAVTGTIGSASQANNWIVLASIAVGLGNVFYYVTARGERTPLTDPIVMVGGVVIVVFVVNENAGRIIVPGVNIESIGVLVFILCLGYAVVRSVFRAEAEFVSVQRELETARQIQRSLLPQQIPKPSGLDLAVRYVPMAAVAGDIYDVVPIGQTAVGILVADVMGHGIPAALVASMVKLAFSIQSERLHDPAAVLTSMNQILCGQVERSYVTAVYAVIDTERHRLTLANAGHPAPLVRRRADGNVQAPSEHGLLLGFLPNATYSNIHLESFDAGDRLLLYSDGVVEARNPAGEFFDNDRLARLLSTIESTSAEQFADTALDELTRWSRRDQFDDDVTFVVAEATHGTPAESLREQA